MKNAELFETAIAGQIWLSLIEGNPEEKESLLRVVEKLAGIEVRQKVEHYLAIYG